MADYEDILDIYSAEDIYYIYEEFSECDDIDFKKSKPIVNDRKFPFKKINVK